MKLLKALHIYVNILHIHVKNNTLQKKITHSSLPRKIRDANAM